MKLNRESWGRLGTLRDDLMADLEELESSLKDTDVVEQAGAFLLGQAHLGVNTETGSNDLSPSRSVERSRHASDVSPGPSGWCKTTHCVATSRAITGLSGHSTSPTPRPSPTEPA